MYTHKSVHVSFIGADDVLQHIVRIKESKYGMQVLVKLKETTGETAGELSGQQETPLDNRRPYSCLLYTSDAADE